MVEMAPPLYKCIQFTFYIRKRGNKNICTCVYAFANFSKNTGKIGQKLKLKTETVGLGENKVEG